MGNQSTKNNLPLTPYKCVICHRLNNTEKCARVKFFILGKNIDLPICNYCLSLSPINCTQIGCSEKVNLISDKSSCLKCKNLFCEKHIIYCHCTDTICKVCLLDHTCSCGETKCDQVGQCRYCYKMSHKLNYVYDALTGCVNKHKIILCCECYAKTDQAIINGSHTKSHYICECKKEFCRDEPQNKCQLCHSPEYHLLPKQVDAACQSCSTKVLNICHKCMIKDIKYDNYQSDWSFRFNKCICGEQTCDKHITKRCQYCANVTHKTTNTLIQSYCNECPPEYFDLCCGCLSRMPFKKGSYCQSWRCEINSCDELTCYKHRQVLQRPKRCKDHQLVVSQKWKYGKAPINQSF